MSDWTALAESLLELLDRFELQSLTFQRGVEEAELRTLLVALASTKPETITPGFWKKVALEHALKHIQPQQVRYANVVRARGAAGRRAAGEEERLDALDLAEIPKILRALQATAKAVRLYPVESEPVGRAVEQFHASLQDVLFRRQTLTLACAGEALLGNGARLDTAGYESAAGPVVELLDGAGLESVTWFAGVPSSEMAVFFGALRDLPDRVRTHGSGTPWSGTKASPASRSIIASTPAVWWTGCWRKAMRETSPRPTATPPRSIGCRSNRWRRCGRRCRSSGRICS